ncbi:MAG: signal peptide peptidase SppA [Desulfobacca sp.]|uniref:signal peptide peptidase SppA n=1 Tax=Desulfobacca sp. TaxID=2067990 RepID=UPI004049D3CA
MAKRSPAVILLLLGVILLFFSGVLLFLLPLTSGPGRLVRSNKIGVVEVSGMITDARTTINTLKKFRESAAIRAIVLRVNSPGGAVGPSQEILAEVKRTRQEKKVVASLGTVAASGGYYIASGADVIMANPGTLTGSIGVIMNFTNIEQLTQKLGIELFNLKAGRFKDAGSPTRPMTPGERAYLQKLIDNVHEQFILDVARGRKMLLHKVREVADGRVFTGEMAQQLGLVDQLGNLSEAIDLAGKLAGLTGKLEAVYPPKERFSLFRLLLGDEPEELLSRWLGPGTASPAYLFAPGQ